MSDVLAKQLRPRSFSKIFGQDIIIASIRKQLASKRIPQAWIFTGETGSGKTTIARILARSLNCPHQKIATFGRFCKICDKIKQQLNIAQVNAAKYNTKEAAEGLADMAYYAPTPPSKYRIFLLDEAQKMSSEAQNLLLTPFEEPPPTTIWIICTTEINKIIKPLRRRCKIYSMLPIKHRTTEEFIKWAAEEAGIKRDTYDLIHYIHRENITSPGIMLAILENFASGLDPDRAAASAPLGIDTMRIIKGMTAGEWTHIRHELDRATPDEARLIRAAIIGYFKHELLQKTPSVSRKLIPEAIEAFANISYGIDEPAQLALVCSRIYSMTEKFKKV